jgi:hypothetical protein
MKRSLLGILLVCSAVSAFGQTLPIKEGLWESIAYNDDGTPSVRILNCVTQKNFAEMLTKASSQPGCKVTSQNITSHGMTVDISCSRHEVQTSMHQVLELVDAEHTRGTTTLKMTNKGKSSDSTTKSDGHFVKSDCGKVKPDAPEIE